MHPFDIRTVLLAKHAQHVVLIHFPIALFITGVAFDLVAQWTKRDALAEAAYLGDQIVLMNNGRIVQQGSIADLRERPASDFVSEFINAQRGLALI